MTARPTVLLCDDSRALRMLAAGQLEEAGFEVVGEAGNGVQALEQYRALRPDLVLLDLVMPECDGRQALSRILEHDPRARVVILSSLGAQSDIEQCLRMVARSYLQKPIDPDAMERVLRPAGAAGSRRDGPGAAPGAGRCGRADFHPEARWRRNAWASSCAIAA